MRRLGVLCGALLLLAAPPAAADPVDDAFAALCLAAPEGEVDPAILREVGRCWPGIEVHVPPSPCAADEALCCDDAGEPCESTLDDARRLPCALTPLLPCIPHPDEAWAEVCPWDDGWCCASPLLCLGPWSPGDLSSESPVAYCIRPGVEGSVSPGGDAEIRRHPQVDLGEPCEAAPGGS